MMTSESPNNHAPEDEMEDATPGDSDVEDLDNGSPSLDASGQKQSKSAAPVQKRRRVTRACDECRRKKIKCDGKQPCTHCTVYSYGTHYEQYPRFR